MCEVRKVEQNEEDRLLKLQEGQFVDLKSWQIRPAKLQTHFVALANTDGGELFVGIEDPSVKSERIVGFRSAEEANDLIHTLLGLTEPQVDGVDVELIDFNERGHVLHVSIPKSEKVHYTSEKECYVRLNASSRKIAGDAVIRLSYSKAAGSYERTIVKTATMDEIIESDYFCEYIDRIGARSPEKFLRRQRLIQEDLGFLRPITAGVLLFDDEPQSALTSRCAIKVYRLLTSESEYQREQLAGEPLTIDGPLERQIDGVIECVSVVLKDASYKVDGKLVKLEYPAEALKELLVNAVIHRDYSLSDDIHVRIYNNRIEIVSPGRLPGYITLKNMLEERYSRNPVIVRLLHKLPNPPNKDIGEGLDTAFNKMHEAGLVNPEIEELDNAVRVTVRHQLLASLEDVIMCYLKENEWVTNKVIRELSGEKSENKIKNAFRKLRDTGKIEPENGGALPWKFRYRLKKQLLISLGAIDAGECDKLI